MLSYTDKYYQYISQEVNEGILCTFCLSAVLFLIFRWGGRGLFYPMVLLLVEYVFLVFCFTVIFRTYHENQKHYLLPFWSYKAIMQGKEELIVENIMNVLVFVPIGLLLGYAFKCMGWWKVFLFGCSTSIVIEVLQFVTKRGFAEVDDIMHNTLGCMIGYGVYLLVKSGYLHCKK